MIVFGGENATSARLNDTWVLPLAAGSGWTQIFPSGTVPSGRRNHTAILDPVRNRMIVFAGIGATTSDAATWALSLSGSPAWSYLGSAPGLPIREWQSAIYDGKRDRMVVFGGYQSGTIPYFNDTWALSFSPTPLWSHLAPTGPLPCGRYLHVAAYDESLDRMVVFGGFDNRNYFDDTWLLDWHLAVGRESEDQSKVDASELPGLFVPAGDLGFELPGPNPARGQSELRITTRVAGSVQLDLFDSSGRALDHLIDGFLEAGRHQLVWDGKDVGGRPLPSGIYFFRLHANGESLVRKMTLVR